MARLARVVVPGFPHHVKHWSNRHARLFDNDRSRQSYLELVGRYARACNVEIWAYCLLKNHVHWVVVPKTASSLADCFRGAHTRFAVDVNAARGESGHLWENRFQSCPLDRAHLAAVLRYVENNPVRAKLVGRAEAFRWSSAVAHCGSKDPAGILSLAAWRREYRPKQWRAALRKEPDPAVLKMIRLRTRTGRPLGAPEFMRKTEELLGRRLRPLPVGRPPGRKNKAPSGRKPHPKPARKRRPRGKSY